MSRFQIELINQILKDEKQRFTILKINAICLISIKTDNNIKNDNIKKKKN